MGKPKYPFIEAGKHKLALAVLEEFMHSSDGQSVRALFEVLESNKHQPGTYVVKIWKLIKPPKFANKDSDGVLFTDFCRKLKGAPASYVMSNDIRVLVKERAAEQLARGTVIECVGVMNKKGTWTDIYWNTIEQAPSDIAAMRQRMETKGIPDSGGGMQQQTQQAPYQQPQQPTQYQATQHAYAPQQQAQPAPQGPPPGGFLANVPTNNGGNGGNQGGSW